MKFTIRFADQLVGGLIILALAIVVFVIFMLGSSQRWFSRDYQFQSYFNSASGISQNMPVQYKGFTIGRVKSLSLTDADQVEVLFTIFDTYIDRVKLGSLVEVLVSPIGMGNQFMFYPGAGASPLNEGATIPTVNSVEGKRLLASGLAVRPERDDSINNIMNRAGTLLTTLNDVLVEVQDAFTGTDQTTLGRTLGEVEVMARGLRVLSQTLPDDLQITLRELTGQLDPVLAQLDPVIAQINAILENVNQLSAGLIDPNSVIMTILDTEGELYTGLIAALDSISATLQNINQLSGELVNPDGTIMSLLDSEGDLYTNLISSLEAISATLKNLEKTTDFIPTQLPQVALLLADLHTALKTAEEVLIALTNNPLLKGGIPKQQETRAGGVRPRDAEF
jgi:phospholipid/cholesterol/gamma-HCH transport system substrate-binding protein